jgi:hypothetical protein
MEMAISVCVLQMETEKGSFVSLVVKRYKVIHYQTQQTCSSMLFGYLYVTKVSFQYPFAEIFVHEL